MVCVGCREQFAGGKSVLAYDDNGYVRHGSRQSTRPDLPEVTPAPIQHAQLGRGGQVRRLLRQGPSSFTPVVSAVDLVIKTTNE